ASLDSAHCRPHSLTAASLHPRSSIATLTRLSQPSLACRRLHSPTAILARTIATLTCLSPSSHAPLPSSLVHRLPRSSTAASSRPTAVLVRRAPPSLKLSRSAALCSRPLCPLASTAAFSRPPPSHAPGGPLSHTLVPHSLPPSRFRPMRAPSHPPPPSHAPPSPSRAPCRVRSRPRTCAPLHTHCRIHASRAALTHVLSCPTAALSTHRCPHMPLVRAFEPRTRSFMLHSLPPSRSRSPCAPTVPPPPSHAPQPPSCTSGRLRSCPQAARVLARAPHPPSPPAAALTCPPPPSHTLQPPSRRPRTPSPLSGTPVPPLCCPSRMHDEDAQARWHDKGARAHTGRRGREGVTMRQRGREEGVAMRVRQGPYAPSPPSPRPPRAVRAVLALSAIFVRRTRRLCAIHAPYAPSTRRTRPPCAILALCHPRAVSAISAPSAALLALPEPSARHPSPPCAVHRLHAPSTCRMRRSCALRALCVLYTLLSHPPRPPNRLLHGLHTPHAPSACCPRPPRAVLALDAPSAALDAAFPRRTRRTHLLRAARGIQSPPPPSP
ncbi:hypothetical protein DENSPDRAFT_886501, partial [Dentipellis sp. KUC8613]